MVGCDRSNASARSQTHASPPAVLADSPTFYDQENEGPQCCGGDGRPSGN